MGIVQDIEILMLKRGSNKSDLARRLGDSPQNVGQKFKRNTIKDEDVKQIAAALGCDFYYTFIDRETGEEVHRGKL